MKLIRTWALSFAALCLTLTAATVQAGDKTAPAKDIVGVAAEAGSFKTLVTAIKASNGVIHVIDTVILP